MNEFETKIYKARYKFFTYILYSIIFLTLLLILINLIMDYKIIITEIGLSIIYWILLIFITFWLVIFTILIFTYHTLRYEFKEDKLLLIYGPFKDKIYYKDIISWENKNLEFIPLSLVGLSGISLFDRFYSNEGKVRMYGTSMGSKVLLIYTNKRKYGITPQNESEFVEELDKRVKEVRRVDKL
ncbi:MAG: hypothetical protein H5U37_04720 [Caldisericia bacterium]|nr:hypothetical protein [Caldisericia bacterium]